MRFQILHLPAPADEYPFALVIDGVTDAQCEMLDEAVAGGLADAVGARTVVISSDRVEID